MMLLSASLTQHTASLQFTSPPFRVHLHPLHLRCTQRRAVKVQASKAASDRLTEVIQAESAFDRLPLSTHAAKVLRSADQRCPKAQAGEAAAAREGRRLPTGAFHVGKVPHSLLPHSRQT